MKKMIAALVVVTAMLLNVPAFAGEAEAKTDVGLNVELQYATAYVFRGLNLFDTSDQMAQNMLLAPAINWSIFDTGLVLGYWSAWQLNGDNKSYNVDAGVGHEQDLILSYNVGLGETMALGAGLVYYFYPFADKDTAGTSVPSYLEPYVDFKFSFILDLGAKVAYYYGVQDAIEMYRYLYLSPYIGKSFDLLDIVGLGFKVSYGYKLWNDSDMEDNTHDVTLTVDAPIKLGKMFYVIPHVDAAWTNLPLVDFKDEYVIFGGVTAGVNF